MLYVFFKNTRGGLCDRSGKVVVYPKFYTLFSHSYDEDYICGRWEFGTAFLNNYGSISANLHIFADRFTEELARFSIHKSWGFMNKDFKVAIEPKFDEVKSFREGLAAAKVGEKWGYINKNGDMVIDPVFDIVHEDFLGCEPRFGSKGYFNDGIACVGVDDMWGFIDRSGKFLFNTMYEDADGFSSGLAPVKIKGEWGYLDRDGKLVIEPQYGEATCFINGFAQVYVGKSEWLEEDEEEEIEEGTQSEEIGKGWTFIDTQGKRLTELLFAGLESFEDGVAPVELNDKWGIIDINGGFVVKPKYDRIYSWEKDGVVLAKLNDVLGLIDKEKNYDFTPINILDITQGDFEELDDGKVVIWRNITD